MLTYNNHLKISKQHYIPPNIPDCIKFVPFDNQWRDDKMNDTDIYIFTDAAIYYNEDNPDPQSHIYGYGGGAVVVYHKHKQIQKWIYPVTSRTHINTMELYQFYKVFQCIINNTIHPITHQIHNNNTIPKIHIISDSQNSINIIQQRTYPKDDAMIQIHKQINRQLENIQKESNTKSNIFIMIHWVKSHDESKDNNDVDGYAKTAASLVRYLSNYMTICTCNNNKHNDNHTLVPMNNINENCTCIWRPNQYISYNTVKNEIKYRIKQQEQTVWNQYADSRSTKWAYHYHLFNIQYNATYPEELQRMTQMENTTRIMLYTNHLPLNSHKHFVMNNPNITTYCDNLECEQQQIDESLFHYLFECPRYIKQRKIYIDNTKLIYIKHNVLAMRQKHTKTIKQHKRKIRNFITDKHNHGYLRQFIFPPYDMDINDKIDILKHTISYIRNTGRFFNYCWAQ